MYENMTYDYILNKMLNRVAPDIDKREGSIIYDALAPAAIELAQAYIDMDVMLKETFADTASREFLDRRCAERGIIAYPATKTILKAEFNTDIPINSRFTLKKLYFKAIEKIAAGIFKMECETEGTIGNKYFGALTPVDYIDGLSKAELKELLIPGEDIEETEHLRKRYMDSFAGKAFGGNLTDYKEKVESISGVGGVKPYPVWNGGGTVKVVFMTSEFKKPTTELIAHVQDTIDPLGEGKGYGIAPIGHKVTVEGVNSEFIDIAFNLTYKAGYDFESLRQQINDTVDAYLHGLNMQWADLKEIVIRVSQLESRMLDLDGIVDINSTKINSVEGNYTAGENSIVLRGEISEQTG